VRFDWDARPPEHRCAPENVNVNRDEISGFHGQNLPQFTPRRKVLRLYPCIPAWLALRGGSYQLQSATNLTQSNWTNYGKGESKQGELDSSLRKR